MSGVKAAGLDYGRMRLWGSLSFILASIVRRLGGRAARRGRGHLAGGRRWRAHRRCRACPAAPDRTRPPESGDRPAAPRAGGRAWAAAIARVPAVPADDRRWCRARTPCSTPSVSCTGKRRAWIRPGRGCCGASPSFARSCCLPISAAVLRRIGPVQLIMLGCGAAVVRWLLMGFDPPLALLVLLQISHSLTYTASHIGAIHFMSRAVPEQQAGTAQALYASVTGGIGHWRGHADRRTPVCWLRRTRLLGDGNASPPLHVALQPGTATHGSAPQRRLGRAIRARPS